MKNIRKILRVLGALALASGSHLAHAQAVGGNGTVQGAAANGANVAGNPVLTGGSDGTKARTLKTDATGQLYIANPGSGGGVVTQSDHTLLLGTSFQGGTWLDQIMGVDGTSIATAINPFPVSIQGAIPAGTNVIGHVINDASSAVIGHVIADSGSTTAVTGNVTAVQATGSNLHVQVDTAPTTTVTGTVTANIGTSGSLALDATLTGGTQKSQLVSSGGNAAAVDSAGNVAAKGGFMDNPSLTVSSLNGDLLPSADVSAYKWVSVQITTQATGGTSSFQESNDNSNWFNMALTSSTSTVAGPVVSTTGTGLFHGPIYAHYFRVRETAYSSGSATGTVEFYTIPGAFNSVGIQGGAVAQSGTWTVQPGNTANTTPWLMTPAAGTTGGYSFNHISTNATTTVKSGAGTLHAITINTPGATDTLTVYDNTAGSGTVIAVINDASTNATTLTYDVAFATGLTIVSAGTTAPDVTAAYK